jgi:hypothetical protein
MSEQFSFMEFYLLYPEIEIRKHRATLGGSAVRGLLCW